MCGCAFITVCLLTTREAALYVISVVSVCLSVCQAITFESLDVGSSYLHIRYISREYGSGSYMKVIGSRSQEQKGQKSLFLHLQCKTSMSNNSGFGYGGLKGVTAIFVT